MRSKQWSDTYCQRTAGQADENHTISDSHIGEFNMMAVWDVTPCTLPVDTKVSKEPAAFVFKTEHANEI
jgi:hypothetical protein